MGSETPSEDCDVLSLHLYAVTPHSPTGLFCKDQSLDQDTFPGPGWLYSIQAQALGMSFQYIPSKPNGHEPCHSLFGICHSSCIALIVYLPVSLLGSGF